MKKTLFVFLSMLITIGHLLKGDLSSSYSVELVQKVSPIESQPMATKADLIHSIILLADRVIINTNAFEKDLPFTALSTFVYKHRHHLNQQKLSIAVSKETHYRDVIKIIELMASVSIKHYQLVRYD